MNTKTLTGRAMRAKAVNALLREVGPAGYVRFLQDLYPGHGNYTEERHSWLDAESFEEVSQALLRMGLEESSKVRSDRRKRRSR